MSSFPKEFIEKCKSITKKRARTVIDHILKYGHITTEDIKKKYGYEHAPRATRDVKECGIQLEKFTVNDSKGKKIAAYRFSKKQETKLQKRQGRTGFSKEIKRKLIEKYGSRCFIYLEDMDEKELQIDHRVPYQIGGDDNFIDQSVDNYMLLCGSANRAKSWSCEHCKNWSELKKIEICLKCYWAYPENYEHVAMRQVRRLDLIWQGDEISTYDELKRRASQIENELPKFVKKVLEKAMKRNCTI